MGAAAVLSAVSSFAGAQQQAKSQEEQDQYQAQVAANNATIATNNAQNAEAAGAQQAADKGLQTRNTVGAILASQAASGLDVNSGSNVDVRSSASEVGQLDALTIRSNAARQAYSYETQAAGDQAEISQDQAAEKNAETAGNISEFSSLLGSASSAGNQYATWSRVGGTSSGSPF